MLKCFKSKNKRLKYISADTVLKEAVTDKDYSSVSYIICKDSNAKDFKIIMTICCKSIEDDMFELLSSYDCSLCLYLNEYEKLPEEEIENRAYNYYMTGAR